MINLTILGWVGFFLVAIIAIVICAFMGAAIADNGDVSEVIGGLIGVIVGIIISFFILLGFNWYFNSTARGIRALKTQESNLNNGINRKVTVYDVNGNVIQEYEGKFDVEYDDDRILFDDEKGLRHIIYYPTGTVIIDEVE